MSMYKLRSGGFNYDPLEVSRETARYPNTENDPSRTIQSGKDDADINVIVRRFGVTGQLPPVLRMPSYGDFMGVNDFQSAMNVVRASEEAFMELPSAVRAKFGNSPQAFLDFASNPDNIDELRKMGLANPKKDDTLPKPVVPANSEGNLDVKGNAAKGASNSNQASGKSEGDSGSKS